MHILHIDLCKPTALWLYICGRYIPLPTSLSKTPLKPQVCEFDYDLIDSISQIVNSYDPHQFWLKSILWRPSAHMLTGSSLLGAGGFGFALHSAYIWTASFTSNLAGNTAAGGHACICEVTCPTFPLCPPCFCAECPPVRAVEQCGPCPRCLSLGIWLVLAAALAVSFLAGYWCSRCCPNSHQSRHEVQIAVGTGDPFDQPYIPPSRIHRRWVIPK